MSYREYDCAITVERADLNLRWAHMSEGMFLDVPAQKDNYRSRHGKHFPKEQYNGCFLASGYLKLSEQMAWDTWFAFFMHLL